ncbi:hypothetical protein BC829DRAFT_410737 [Chytridium lagenaria]|nr:hypothetical protein BC829DRAFT_410737 [Chytridium lagenaria]
MAAPSMAYSERSGICSITENTVSIVRASGAMGPEITEDYSLSFRYSTSMGDDIHRIGRKERPVTTTMTTTFTTTYAENATTTSTTSTDASTSLKPWKNDYNLRIRYMERSIPRGFKIGEERGEVMLDQPTDDEHDEHDDDEDDDDNDDHHHHHGSQKPKHLNKRRDVDGFFKASPVTLPTPTQRSVITLAVGKKRGKRGRMSRRNEEVVDGVYTFYGMVVTTKGWHVLRPQTVWFDLF